MSRRLSLERRKLIEEHLSSGWSFRRIAAALCVVASSVSRAVSRNGGAAGYRAAVAQERAVRMRVGVGVPCVCVLAWAAAREKLGLRWGPEQVAGAVPPDLVISASTIRRRVKADWTRQRTHLRRRGKPYLSRAERRAQSCDRIPNRVHFSQRPPQADACAQRGHWEMDALLDPGAHRRARLLHRPPRPPTARHLRKRRRPGARQDPREKVGKHAPAPTARHRRAHQPAPDENPPMALPKSSRQTIIIPPGSVALSMTMCINPRPTQGGESDGSALVLRRICVGRS